MFGLVASTPSLPLVWTLNQLLVTRAAGSVEVLAAAEAYQQSLPYRHVVVEDPGTSAALTDDVGDSGWAVECDLLMVLDAPADRVVDTAGVDELTGDEMAALMRQWLLEERPMISADGLEQVLSYNHREAALWGERVLGRRDDSGRAVAVTKLRSDGPCAWVEDVYTAPAHRGRGMARALVTRATELVRGSHDLVFIVADDADWPKELYAKIGFRPAGRRWTFHRDLTAR